MKASAARTASGVPCWAWPWWLARASRVRPVGSLRGAKLLWQQCDGLVEKGPRLGFIDRRQAVEIEIGKFSSGQSYGRPVAGWIA